MYEYWAPVVVPGTANWVGDPGVPPDVSFEQVSHHVEFDEFVLS